MTDAVLVTGAGGLVGAALVEALAVAGRPVIALDRVLPPDPILAAWRHGTGKVQPVALDVRDAASVGRLIERHGVRRIVHGATITAGAERDARDPESIVEVNVLGTIALLRAARRAAIERVLVLSSNAVYGSNALKGEVLDEVETPPDPQTLYAITKFAAERSALRLAALWSVPATVVRLTSIFGRLERATGARDTLSPLWQVVQAARAGRAAILPGPGRRDWMYSRDVASGLMAMLDAPALPEPLYHLGPGRTTSVAAWCERLARRFPDFSWRLAEAGEAPTIDYFGFGERRPLAVARFMRDTQFRPAWDDEAALGDWLDWLDDATNI